MTNEELAQYLRVSADLSGGTPDHMAWIKPDLARLAADRLCPTAEPSEKRMLEALRTIRFSGRNEHPTAVWMQKVAAHAMEPNKWPAQHRDPPADEPSGDAPIPPGYRALSDVIAEHEKDPVRKAAIDKARAALNRGAKP